MSYSSASDVSALAPHLLGSSGSFDASSNPTLTEVNSWLSTGCGIIEATIGTRGYGAIGVSSPAYGIAQAAESFYGAWMAELSLISARINYTENTRDERFKRAFQSQLDILMKLDLSVLGVSRSRSIALAYAGGISQSDKDANDDGDIVQSRFQRGQFMNPEGTTPVSNTPSAS